MIVRVLVAAFLMTLACPVARADKAAALAPYREGAKAYAAGEYFIALEKFRESYAHAQSASTIYNIAQCLRQLGDHAEAVKAYRRYLEIKPNASDAASVRATIQKEEELARTTAPPPAVVVKVEPPPPVVVPPPVAPPVAAPPVVVPSPRLAAELVAPPERSGEEHNARNGLIVGVTVGVLLVVGLSLGVGLGVGLSRGGPKSDLGTIRPEFN